MPTTNKNERTRAGCWTCRARRKKCDENRPRCSTCHDLGLHCEGYAFRLKWSPRAKASVVHLRSGNGKGFLNVRPSPGTVADSSVDEVLIYHLGKDLYQSLTDLQREIMQGFIDWGATILMARVKIHPERYFEVFAGSKALLMSCLAYQIALDPQYTVLVEQYYARSIEHLRHEIAHPAYVNRVSTVYAGLVLCSISMTRGLPWTFHLNGISSLLHNKRAIRSSDGQVKDYVFFMGILDLPTHVLGRKTNSLRIWSQFCRNHTGIEDGVGLPCSLVDLLCSIKKPGIGKRLQSWPIEDGTPEQLQIWDLNRHAGIIMARKYHSDEDSNSQNISDELAALSVRHIITVVTEVKAKVGRLLYETWSALLFPLVAAGSQSLHLSVADKILIIECIKDFPYGSLEAYPYYGRVVTALHELWESGGGRSLEEVVVDLDMELGLF